MSCTEQWLPLLLQHEKYSSQLQMSLKASEGKKAELEERPRGDRVPSTKSVQQGAPQTPQGSYLLPQSITQKHRELPSWYCRDAVTLVATDQSDAVFCVMTSHVSAVMSSQLIC